MAAAVAAVGVLTAWGDGVAALPADAARAAAGRRVMPMARPTLPGERFRRATTECLHGVAAVQALLRDGVLAPDALRGPDTALVYVTAAAYGASNLAFVAGPSAAGGAGTLHFPYTAPSAVPAEVAIEFGLTGPYVILIGAGTATVDALWQAECLLDRGQAERAIVLAVETFAACEALWARGRWIARGPLVEAAAAALLTRAPSAEPRAAAAVPDSLDLDVTRRAGETLACAPLIALALARARGEHATSLRAAWRGRRAWHDVPLTHEETSA